MNERNDFPPRWLGFLRIVVCLGMFLAALTLVYRDAGKLPKATEEVVPAVTAEEVHEARQKIVLLPLPSRDVVERELEVEK